MEIGQEEDSIFMKSRHAGLRSWAIRSAKESPEAWLVGFAVTLGTIVKLWLDATTIGTNDVAYWYRFTQYILHQGTVTIYRDIPYYNHPPLVSSALWVLGHLTAGAPGIFPFLFRLPAIFADVGSSVLLWRMASYYYGRRTALYGVTLFALNPILIMVSGFHGNTDPVFIFFILLGAYSLLIRGSWPAAALCLGVSLNIKIAPVLVLPAFFFWIPGWRRRVGFLVVVGLLGVAGFGYHLGIAFAALWKNIFSYSGIIGIWGLGRLWMDIRETFSPSIQAWFPAVTRYLMLGLILLYAGVKNARGLFLPGQSREEDDSRRGLDLLESIGGSFLIFLVFAPGFGVQYLSWLVGPGVFLGTAGLFLYTLVASVFLFRVYTFWSGGFPWGFADSDARGQWTGGDRTLDLLLWLLLAGWAAVALLSWIGRWKGARDRRRRAPRRLPPFPSPGTLDGKGLNIAILVLAPDAEARVQETLARIPRDVADQITEIMIVREGNADSPQEVPFSRHGDDRITVQRNNRNKGYGGGQKVGLEKAIARGHDIVVTLHADGQYAPEVLATLLKPLVEGRSEMVFGSRLGEGAHPLRDGMPWPRYLGNRFLTAVQNRLARMNLSEFHSGYRAYRCSALKRIPFSLNSDAWHFDTEILLEFQAAGFRIAEVPIPTYSGNEIGRVKGLVYALHCLGAAVSYRLTRWGLWQDVKYRPEIWPRFPYEVKTGDPYSSQRIAVECAAKHPVKRSLLEIGPGSGAMTEQFCQLGYEVTVVESNPAFAEMARKYAAHVICQDVEAIPWEALANYDVVILADILEHLRDPLNTLQRCVDHLQPGGRVLITLPNAAHWSVRVEILLGRFQYRPRGILDQSHLRFFTKNSAESLIKMAGLRVMEDWAVPIPLPLLVPATREDGALAWVHILNQVFTQTWKTLLAYQWGFWCQTAADTRTGELTPGGMIGPERRSPGGQPWSDLAKR